jgi:hypothetical protein
LLQMALRREAIYDSIVEAHHTLFLKLAAEFSMSSGDITPSQEDKIQNASLLLTHVVCEWIEQNGRDFPGWDVS